MRVMPGLLLLTLLALVALVGCDNRSEPPSPAPGNPSGDVLVSGRERIGWNQRAADAIELSVLEFAVYVDGVRAPLGGVSCSDSPAADGFECTAPLPSLTPGPHMLELASVVTDPSGAVESARSAPLRVVMTGLSGTPSRVAPVPIATSEGVTLLLERLTDGVRDPVDLAFGLDSAMFVAERAGTVRVVRDGQLAPTPALDISAEVTLPDGGLLGLAVDPKFEETQFLYALYAGPSTTGLDVMLARFRDVDDRLGERATLLTRASASLPRARGALRFGEDGKLYVGIDGEILRLNSDATTPDDHLPFTPVYSADHPGVTALDWHPRSGELWAVDGVPPQGGRLAPVLSPSTQLRRVPPTAYRLPQGTGAASAAFYRADRIPIFRGDLFIAAEEARELIRVRFDTENPTRIRTVDRLLKDEIGPVRVVAEGRDGAVYVASDTAVYRLAPP